MTFDMTDHFLPDYHDCGEPTLALEKLIQVPIRRVPRVLKWDTNGPPPYNVFTCTWFHLNSQGALTKEKWEKDLAGAFADFAAEVNADKEFQAYPLTYKPPVTSGVAYHDWCGASYPFDVRIVIALDENIDTGFNDEDGVAMVETGLKFHLITLLGNPEYVGE